MHKKNLFLASTLVCFLLLISFSGCLEEEKKVDPTIQKIKDAGKLVVGTSTPYEPMEYIENDEYVGFDIDLAEKIAEHFGVVVEIIDYTDYEDFEDILDYVTNGDVDIMAYHEETPDGEYFIITFDCSRTKGDTHAAEEGVVYHYDSGISTYIKSFPETVMNDIISCVETEIHNNINF